MRRKITRMEDGESVFRLCLDQRMINKNGLGENRDLRLSLQIYSMCFPFPYKCYLYLSATRITTSVASAVVWSKWVNTDMSVNLGTVCSASPALTPISSPAPSLCVSRRSGWSADHDLVLLTPSSASSFGWKQFTIKVSGLESWLSLPGLSYLGAVTLVALYLSWLGWWRMEKWQTQVV